MKHFIHKIISFALLDTEKLEQPYFGGFQLNWNPSFSKIVRNAPEIPSKIPSQEFGNLPKCITNQSEIACHHNRNRRLC